MSTCRVTISWKGITETEPIALLFCQVREYESTRAATACAHVQIALTFSIRRKKRKNIKPEVFSIGDLGLLLVILHIGNTCKLVILCRSTGGLFCLFMPDV
jgi:hypothetical protein